MNKNMKCPLCKEEIYSEMGKGCKMCGMILSNKNAEFCSESCESNYKSINGIKNKNGK